MPVMMWVPHLKRNRRTDEHCRDPFVKGPFELLQLREEQLAEQLRKGLGVVEHTEYRRY